MLLFIVDFVCLEKPTPDVVGNASPLPMASAAVPRYFSQSYASIL